MTVHKLPGPSREVILTKAQLADHLHRSTRWVEQKAAAGMPKLDTDRHGRRKFRLSDVEAWLANEQPPSQAPTTANLEARVRALEERVAALEAEAS